MKQDGVEVRPIEQVDGSAEFCEVFFTERAVPEGQRRRRRQQRLERRHDDARLRAGHVRDHRLPPLREGARRHHRQGARRTARSTIPSSARASPTRGRRCRSCASTACARSRAVVQNKKDLGVAALGATNKMFWSEYHQRGDGAGDRRARHGRPDPHRRPVGRGGGARLRRRGAPATAIPRRCCSRRSSSPAPRRSGAARARSSATSSASASSVCPRSPSP